MSLTLRQWYLASPASWASSANFPVGERLPAVPSGQVSSSLPTAVLSVGRLSKPHVPALSPPLRQETHNSAWGVQDCSADPVCSSHFFLLRRPAAAFPSDCLKRLFCSSWFPCGGPFLSVGISFHLQLPVEVAGPFQFSFLFFSFLLSNLVVWGFFLSFAVSQVFC